MENTMNKTLDDLIKAKEAAEQDAFVLAGRLMSEDPITFGPEVTDAMERWEPRVLAAMRGYDK